VIELRVNAKRKYIGELNSPRPKIEMDMKVREKVIRAAHILTLSSLKCALFDVVLKIIIKF
jgi:hypothetical protein